MEVYIVTQRPFDKNSSDNSTKFLSDNYLYLTLKQEIVSEKSKLEIPIKIPIKNDEEKNKTETENEEEKKYVISLEPRNDNLMQVWKIYSTTKNAVCIKASNEELVLDVIGGFDTKSGSSSDDYRELSVWTPNGAPNQRFYLYDDGTIRPENNNFCISPIPKQDNKNILLCVKRIDEKGVLEIQKFHLSTPMLSK